MNIVHSNADKMSRQFSNTLSCFVLTACPLYFVKDTFFSIHRVRGNDMSPSICDGDIVLVKKADFLPGWTHEKLSINDLNEDSPKLDEVNDRHLTLRMDEISGIPRPSQMTLWRYPPVILSGDVVAIYNPTSFRQVKFRRVVALGGQRVRKRGSYHKIMNLRPYSFYAEKDRNESEIETDDIRNEEVTKKLLIGVAERIVWPPSRWGTIERRKPTVGRSWWP
jgi:signal peptidase I